MKRIICFAILMFASSANASVIWQLNNFNFDDGATAVGQFEWDEATNNLLNWNIDVLPIANGSPGTYSNTTGAAIEVEVSNLDYLLFCEPNCSGSTWNFRIGLSDLDSLDTPVASLLLFSNSVGATGANGFLECKNCISTRQGLAGAYLSAVVPEPSIIALFGLGLLGTGFARRRTHN